MDYVSTRNKERKVSAAYAIANGIAPDGGLYCPTAFPALTDADWKTLAESDYKGRSALILGKFLTDFTAEELADFASKAYADEKFGGFSAACGSVADRIYRSVLPRSAVMVYAPVVYSACTCCKEPQGSTEGRTLLRVS